MKKKSAAPIPVYQNPAAPVASRVKGLLPRMAVEDQAAQMVGVCQEKSVKIYPPPEKLILFQSRYRDRR